MSIQKTVHTWTVKNEFRADGYVVRVTGNDAYRPRYTIQIGRDMPKEGKLGTYLPVYVEDGLGKASLRDGSFAQTLASLIAQAEAWILKVSQEREDEIITSRLARETKDIERGKKSARPGLKKIGKINQS